MTLGNAPEGREMVAGGKRSAATGCGWTSIPRPGGAQDFDKLGSQPEETFSRILVHDLPGGAFSLARRSG